MDPLWLALGVLAIALGIVLVIYGNRSITSHWAFWVGIALIIGTFIGVPGLIYTITKNL